MLTLPSILLFTFVTAISPGPNNLIVLAEGRRSWLRGLSATAVIVGVSAILVVLVWIFATAVLTAEVARWITVAGAAILGVMAIGAWREAADTAPLARSVPFGSIILLQLANPKSWLMIITVCAAGRSAAVPLVLLLPLMAAIWSVCLTVWVAMGRAVDVAWPARVPRRRFDQGMAVLLGLTALSLFFNGLVQS